MQFEDIAHKYEIFPDPENYPFTRLNIRWHGNFVLIGLMRDQQMAEDVALALEFYKSKNRMIDGVLQNENL